MGLTISAAARRAKYSPRQAARLVSQEEFKQHVAALRSAIVGQASGMLAATAARSIARLTKLLDHEDGAIARRAAKDLLEMTLRFVESHDLSAQIQDIKNALARRVGADEE